MTAANGWLGGFSTAIADWQTAELLTDRLLPFVRNSLSQVKPLLNEEPVSKGSVQRAIVQSFVDLDDPIIKSAVHALCSPYTILSQALCTWRVLVIQEQFWGKKRPDGKWEAVPLSVEQTGSNEEIARVYKVRPGKEIVKDGRVLGMMVSPAFSDGILWSIAPDAEVRSSNAAVSDC
ncbi:hypothetical protein BBP40_006181 [Aspergillus hancockii]|nr:hypothetical protein BBP40_006181 [Aspergillus hancockii]